MATRNLLHRIEGIIPQSGHRRSVVFFLFFFLTTFAPVWAQTVSYYMELRFVQRLSWIGDEYAMRYEVIIEKEDEGEYSRVLREFTDAFFIVVFLPPGKYRYQVIPYDYLDQPVPANEWMNFEVLPGNEKLSTGEHEINIVNPGDETGRTETIILAVPEAEPSGRMETKENTEDQNKFGYAYTGAAWTPLLSISGENMTPYGVAVRLGLISATHGFLSPGVELIASWYTYADTGNQMVQQFTIDLIFLELQTRFSGGRAALNFRLGAGFSFLPGILGDVHADIGASFLWLLLKKFYMEVGLDYSPFLTKDDFGFFRFWIGPNLRF